MKYGPDSLDVEAILLAAGIDRPSMAQRRRVKAALALYARSIVPRTAEARERWRQRATRLRDRHAPHVSWGSSETDDDPTA